MKRTRAAATGLFCMMLAVTTGGCMRGMTYKMPMPDSMTLGTVKDEPTPATLASAKQPAKPNTLAQAER